MWRAETLTQIFRSTAGSAYKTAKTLYDIYATDEMRPPAWSLAFVKKKIWTEFAKTVEVLTFDERSSLVKKVATQREPVNIAMQPGFDSVALQSAFGYNVSGYSASFSKDETMLPPNLAIYMKTPMNRDDGPVAHVISAVGFAFDDEKQPDYKYFIAGNREPELLEHLKNVFLLVFACAARKSLPIVVLCLLGGAAFSRLFPGGSDRYVADYFMPALNAALMQLTPASRPKLLGMMGHPDEKMMAMLRGASDGIPCEAYGFVPAICSEPGAAESLFMNAWDPHSVVGNGNAADTSLDGFFGRSSAMGFLSLPSINAHITYVGPSTLRSVL